MNFGTWRVDLATGEPWWSRQMRRICGLGATAAPPDIAGYAELVHPGDRDRVVAELSALVVSGASFDSRHRLIGAEGAVRHVRAIGRAVRDPGGALVAAHGTTQDVSDLIATEARSVHTRQRLALVLANLPGSWVALYDRQLCVRDVEGADAEADLAWQGEHVSTFLTAEGYATLAPVLRAALDGTRGAGDYEHADGRVHHVEVAPFIEDGELTGVLTVWHEVTEQRRAEEARRDADHLFRSAFDHAPVGMVMVGLDGTFLRSNAAISDITGYGPDELAKLPPFSFVHPEDRVDVQTAFADVGGARDTASFEHRIIRADGQLAWVQAHATVMRDARGQPAYVLSQVIDVTARQVAEQALRDSEQRYSAMAANLPGMLYRFAIAPDGTPAVRYASAGARAIYGIEPHRLVQDVGLATGAVHAAERAGCERSVEQSARTLQPWDWRGRFVLPDGNVRHIHGIARPHREADGTTVWDGMLLDESAAAHARQREAEALERFRSAFELAPIGMALVALDGAFVQVNEALCTMVGRASHELVTRTFADITHPDDVHRDLQGLSALLDGAVDVYRAEKRYIHSDGHHVWIALSATAMRGPDGGPTHLLAQIVDVTDRHNAEDRLRHLADHDALTGLANRRRLEAALSDHLARCERYGPEGAVLLLDIDHFKIVNDSRGHAAGDQLLKDVAAVLRRDLRDSDTLARLGGDEFAVLLPRADTAQAARVAAKLVGAVRDVGATISVGAVAIERLERLTVDDALAKADRAMYSAKTAGRDRFDLLARQPAPADGSAGSM